MTERNLQKHWADFGATMEHTSNAPRDILTIPVTRLALSGVASHIDNSFVLGAVMSV